MLNRILVATDFSTRSDRALRRATLIAKRVGASLSLVHAVDADQSPWMVQAERDAALSILEESARSIRDADGVPADAHVVADDVHVGILTVADDVDASLIVLGPHRTRLTDIFIGTTVERVLRRSRRPLLVAVHTPSANHTRTLLALEFDEASKSAARTALAMGVFDHTAVVLMHAFDAPAQGMMQRAMIEPEAVDDYVADEGRSGRAKLQDLVSDLGLPTSQYEVVAVAGTPARSILDAAKSRNADLIVVGTNKRKGFARLLVGSVMEGVLREAQRDVLIVPVDAAASKS
jgi:nucleotide-binding universal stress UspA family protein